MLLTKHDARRLEDEEAGLSLVEVLVV
ncbi:MAG TPA: type II secretion system protein GspG, partial [Oceanicaulis sp.]|nr:type II secretion system protein GspG [Oceanicaulis sp.]